MTQSRFYIHLYRLSIQISERFECDSRHLVLLRNIKYFTFSARVLIFLCTLAGIAVACKNNA